MINNTRVTRGFTRERSTSHHSAQHPADRSPNLFLFPLRFAKASAISHFNTHLQAARKLLFTANPPLLEAQIFAQSQARVRCLLLDACLSACLPAAMLIYYSHRVASATATLGTFELRCSYCT